MKARLACIVSTALTLALVSISIRYITDFWILAFVNSFQLHIAVLAGATALACYVALKARFLLILFVWSALLAAHAAYMHQQFTGVFSSEAAGQNPPGKPFRLISFNVLMENEANAESIAQTIISSGADVAYVMEAAALRSSLPRLLAVYPYRLGCGIGAAGCDLLVLSKRPLEAARIGSLSFLSRDRFGLAQIDLDGVRVSLAAMHLTKPYFDDFHSEELQRAGAIFSGISGPLIVGGDFNAASLSPDVRDFLRDNDLNKVAWEPATWPVAAGRFGIAIDHIFARKPARLVSLKRLPDNLGSNHYGLIADFLISAE